MPDFKGLNPVIVDQSIPETKPGLNTASGVKIPSGGGANPYGDISITEQYANMPAGPGDQVISAQQHYENRRYPYYDPNIANPEDFAAYGQSWTEKMVHGVGKGLALTGTTFLQSTVGMVNGAFEWYKTGKVSSFYNNEMNRNFDKFNEELEDKWANYYKDTEKAAHWYSPSKLFSANFIWDGIIKNLGFSVGAALAGGVFAGALGALGKGLSLIPKLGKMFSVGKGMEALSAIEAGIAEATAGGRAASTYGKLLTESGKFLGGYNALNTGQRIVVAGLATTGEAGFEAYQNLNQFRDQKILEYRNTHGGEFPTGTDLDAINAEADHVGNWSMLFNMGLLSATNYIQFPRILGSSYTAEKGMISHLTRETSDLVQEGGKFVAKPAGNKVLRMLNRVRPYTFSASEGFEEGAQYAITIGTQDYYDKKYRNEKDGQPDFGESLMEGIRETLGTDEGMENVIIGGLSGAIMLGRGKFREARAEARNTQEALRSQRWQNTGLNTAVISEFTKDTYDSVNRGVVLQKERERALKLGDISGSKDLEADYIINYLSPRIKHGRYDLVKEDINTYRTLASSEEGFSQLQAEGKVTDGDTREAYLKRIDNLEQTAENVKNLYQSLYIRYGSRTDDKGNLLYTPEVMDKMVYAASKIADYDKRIPSLSHRLSIIGINVDEVTADLLEGSDKLFKESLQAIDDINKTSSLHTFTDTEIDELKESLEDVGVMALRRNQFLKDYGIIKAAPRLYQDKITTQEEVDAAKAERKTIKVKTRDGEQDVEIGTEYYAGKTRMRTEKGHELIRMNKMTIVKDNGDGTLQIKDSTGKESTVDASSLEGRMLFKVVDAEKHPESKFYARNYNTEVFQNRGRSRGGKRAGWLEYDAENNQLYFAYETVTKKGKITPHAHPISLDQFTPKGEFKEGVYTFGKDYTEDDTIDIEDSKTRKGKDAVIYEMNKKETRRKILEDLTKELTEKHEKTSKVIAEKRTAISIIDQEIAKIKKRIEANSKKANFKSTSMRTINAINRLIKAKDDLEEEISVLEDQNDQLDWTIMYMKDEKTRIEDLPMDVNELMYELNFQLELLNDAYASTDKELEQLKDIVALAEHSLDSAVKLLHDLLNDFKKLYFKGQEVGPGWVELLKNLPSYKNLREEDIIELEMIVAEVEDAEITPNQEILDVYSDDVARLSTALTDIHNQAIAKKALIDRFQKAVDDYKKAKVDEDRLRRDKEQIKEALKTADKKTIETVSYKDGYERAAKKMLKHVWRSTIGIMEGKPHQERANTFGFNLEKMPNRKNIRGLIVNANNEDKLWDKLGLMDYIIANRDPDEPAFTKEEIVAMVMVDISDGEEYPMIVGVDGEPLTIDQLENPIDHIIFQVFPKDTLAWSKKWEKEEGGKKVIDTAIRDTATKAERAKILEEYPKLRAKMLKFGGFEGMHEIEASFGFPDFDHIIGEDGNPVIDKKNRKPLIDYTKRHSVDETGLVESSRKAYTEDLIDIPTLNEAIVQGTSEFHTPLGIPFLRTKEGLVPLKNRKHTAREAENIYQALYHLAKNMMASHDGINSAESQELTNYLKSVVYWDIPETREGERKETASNSVFWEVDKYTKKFMLTLSNTGDRFVFTPDSLANNKELIVDKLMDMHQNVNNSLLKKNEAYSEVVRISPSGEITRKTWINYQAYLLSSKFWSIDPRDKENGTPREDVPLATPMKKIDAENKVNRTAIYFYTIDNAGEVVLPDSEKKKKKKEKKRQEEEERQKQEEKKEEKQKEEKTKKEKKKDKEEKKEEPKKKSEPPEGEKRVSKADLLKRSANVQSIVDMFEEEGDDGIGNARIVLDEKIEDFKAEDWKALEEWFTKNLPHLPIFRLRELINTVGGRRAWGMFKKNALYVFENAEVGTAYHESWHAVWRLFTTPQERAAMESEFKARKGTFTDRPTGQQIEYKDATPTQIEERLAEEFRDYVQRGKVPIKPSQGRPWIVKMFYDLVNWVRNVFNKPAIAEKVDSRIEDMFSKVTTGGFRDVVPYDTEYSFAKEGFIPMESAYADATSQYSIVTIPDVRKGEIMQHLTHLTISRIIDTDKDLFNIMSQKKSELYAWLLKKLIFVVNNRIVQAQKKYDEGEYSENKLINITNDSIELMNNIDAEWESIKKKHEEYLMQYSIQFDENDNLQVNDPDKTNGSDFAEANKVDHFKKAHSALKLLLATVTVVDPESGNNLASSIGGVRLLPAGQVNATLLNRLQHARNAEEMIALFQKLAKDDPNYRKLYGRVAKKDYTYDVSEENGKYRVDLSHIRLKHSSRLLTAFWAYFNKQNPEVKNVYILESGDVVVGDANLSTVAAQLSDDYTNAIITKAKEGQGYFKYDEKKKVFVGDSKKLKRMPENLEEKVKFLSKLGIEFKVSDVNKLRGRMLKMFNDAADGIYRSVEKEKPIVSFSKSAMDISGRLLQLGYVQGMISTPDVDSTFYNINNERTQAFIGTNPASDLFKFISQLDKLNEITTDGTQYGYLNTDSFSQNSVILESLFDDKGNKIVNDKNEGMLSVVYVGGTDNQIKGRQRESSKLTYKDRLVQELNLNLAGYYLNLVPGDASMEWAIYMGNHVGRDKSAAEMKRLTEVIFHGYFLSELLLARENRPIPNVEGRKNNDLRFFKTILNNYKAGLHEEVLNFKGDPDQVYDKFEDKINAALEQYINKQNAALEANLKQYGILNDTDKGWTFENVSIEQELDRKQLDNQLTFLNVNYMINNIEMHKLIYADPYQYTDELKRIKNFNSPRQALVSNSPRMNHMFDRIWNKGFVEGEPGWTNFNQDYFRSVTYKDVMGIVKDVVGYMEPFKETDGGGIISFPAYRQFRIRLGNWGDVEERQYEHDMMYELLLNDPATKPKDLEEFERSNPRVRSAYTPIKPIVSGNKNNGNKWNDILLDKFALYPVSLRLLKDIAEAGGRKKNNAMKLYAKMQKEKIDYVVWENSRKVGVVDPQDMYDSEGKFNEKEFSKQSVINVPFSIMSMQTEVPSKDDGSVTRGSQVTKLITMDMMEAGVPVDFKPGENFDDRYLAWNSLGTESTREKVKEEMSPLYKEIKKNQRLLEDLMDAGYKNLLKQLGIKQIGNSYVISEISKAAVTLRNEILKREVNDNISAALAAFIDGKGVLEATPAYHQVRNILYSIADKEVISPKINGGMKVLIPSDLFEEYKIKGTPYKDKKTGEEKIAYTSDTLDWYEDTDGKRVCEIMIGRWFDSNMSDEELIRYLNTTEGKKLLSGFGFRIPTQRQNSAESFVVKQFLPEEFGDSIVLPAAMVQKTGGDFDIDKLTVYLKNVIRGLDGKPEIVKYQGSEKATRDFYNKMFEDKIAKQLDKIENKKEFKDRLVDILDQIDQRPVIEGVSRVSHRLYMSQEDGMFYEKYFDFIEAITEQAKDQGISATQFVENEIAVLAGENEKLYDRLTDHVLREAYIDRMYKKALQNEYIQSMQNLASHPLNYKRLVDPNSAKELSDLAAEIVKDTVGQSFDYTEVSNMMERGFMSRLRHAFISGKQAIGITAVNQTNHSLNQRQLIYIDPARLENVSEEDKRWLGDARLKFAKFNKVRVNGDLIATLSMIQNADGKDISNIIAQFVDGYVDISKGPWIIELGATPNVTSTWLFLIKAGVPIKTVAYFMNQPIIRDYLRSIESAGYSWLFMDSFVEEIKEQYQSGSERGSVTTAIPSETTLKGMVKKRLRSEENKGAEYLTSGELDQQRFMLDEFLKYAKMAEHMFKVTQGSNFDTATFNDPLLIFKKLEQLNQARNTIVSNVDDLLAGSFVGKLGTTIQEVRKALSELLLSDQKRVTDILHKVLLPYVNTSDRDFLKIAQKAIGDLFDYAVQTDQGLNSRIREVLISKKGVAQRVKKLMTEIEKDPKHPLHGNYLVGKEGIMRVVPSTQSEEVGVNNLKLKNLGSKVYDQNTIIYAFRDIRDYLGKGSLYDDIVELAVLQSGLSRSNISFTSLIPFEDFMKIYNPTLARLAKVNDLEAFEELGVFYRNNWDNDDIVPRKKAALILKKGKAPIYNPAMAFFYKPIIQDAIKNEEVPPLLAQRINEREANSNYMVYTWEKYKELITPEYEKKFKHLNLGETELIKKIKADMRSNGDFSYINRGLFEKVRDEDTGNPLVTSYDNAMGETVYQHVYKMINAWGAGRRANEFYPIDKQSVIDNGFIKTSGIKNSKIIKLFERQESGVKAKPSYSRPKNKTLKQATEEEKREITAKMPDVINPSAKHWLAKEQFKTRQATQFIGQGSFASSTYNYAKLYDEYGLANTGRYNSDDLIYVSSNGARGGRVNPVYEYTLMGAYENIDKAILAGASFIMDTKDHIEKTKNYNLGEIALAEYLSDEGYVRDDKTGIWTPEGKKAKTVASGSLEVDNVLRQKTNESKKCN